ncbi:MAG: bifunctional [glutamate--ammonia ligase]-adenylyl-L-tyrosine phosphorylase/[glutamate--ammonia-ligase] adenylyltransferase [Planctomycetota bacterium]
MPSDIGKILRSVKAESWLHDRGYLDARSILQFFAELSQRLSCERVDALIEPIFQRRWAEGESYRIFNNVLRFVERNPEGIEDLFQDGKLDGKIYDDMVLLFASSQSLSETLIRENESVEWLRSGRGIRYSKSHLNQRLNRQLDQVYSDQQAMSVLRRFKSKETLRIAAGDLILGQRLEHVTAQISWVAIAIVEGALRFARRQLGKKFGDPIGKHGQESQFVVFALGKLGGLELNYSSDIDLIMVYDESGTTSGGGLNHEISIENGEFFSRLSRDMVRLIGEVTSDGFAYRVDLRLRPNGKSGKICNSLDSILQYYDWQGRTWERQAWIKATPIAGDIELGKKLIARLSSWIYRRNLSRADITGIKALKRRIERRALEAGEDQTNIKTGRGGIRDVEFVIQFMQLLNAYEIPEIRTTNTLQAIHNLEKAQCLSGAEATVLSQNYQWLRKVEHRIQIMFDLQTHTLPNRESEIRAIAQRLLSGEKDSRGRDELAEFQLTLKEVTDSNRKILNHLLHHSFGMAFGGLRDTAGKFHHLDRSVVPEMVDLVLDEEPDPKWIERELTKFGFQDPHSAYLRLMELSQETTQFLSSRRCKHFLATVAPTLLKELSKTPDPDRSLATLASVSDSLGAKGILWELFSFNPPTLNLYVRLCASSDYLTGILRSNPGMIDELMDALQLDRLPDFQWLESTLQDLIRGASDIQPIIHSFKNSQHMRVGIRDILGKDDVRETHQTLSDVAEICLKTIAQDCQLTLWNKYGTHQKEVDFKKLVNPFVIVALGKLGGREPNYHSDLDVIFIYDSDPSLIKPYFACLQSSVSPQSFFSKLGSNIIKAFGDVTSSGALYDIDCRLRPTGKSGSLALSIDEFQRYFELPDDSHGFGKAQLWERQALCKARTVYGDLNSQQRVMSMVLDLIAKTDGDPDVPRQIGAMRQAMEKDCSPRNLKRGAGGTVDIEFIVQMLQLQHAGKDSSILVPGTSNAIQCLIDRGFLNRNDGQELAAGYQLLRSVEARLRLMNTTSRHDLPDRPNQLAKLAYLLNYATPEQMENQIAGCRSRIRTIFRRLTA